MYTLQYHGVSKEMPTRKLLLNSGGLKMGAKCNFKINYLESKHKFLK
jgi:hypothetical protein